jgi:hypothetical protein
VIVSPAHPTVGPNVTNSMVSQSVSPSHDATANVGRQQ